MTVKQLRDMLNGMPDEMQVLVPAEPTEGFTGMFFTPCLEESGELEMGGDEEMSEEEFEQQDNLGTLKSEKSFVLVPCSFFEEKDCMHELN